MNKPKYLYALGDPDGAGLLHDMNDWRCYAYSTKADAVAARAEFCAILGHNTRDYSIIRFKVEK